MVIPVNYKFGIELNLIYNRLVLDSCGSVRVLVKRKQNKYKTLAPEIRFSFF